MDLALAPDHRREHSALYDESNHDRINVDRLRRTLADPPPPVTSDDQTVPTANAPWLCLDAPAVSIGCSAAPMGVPTAPSF